MINREVPFQFRCLVIALVNVVEVVIRLSVAFWDQAQLTKINKMVGTRELQMFTHNFTSWIVQIHNWVELVFGIQIDADCGGELFGCRIKKFKTVVT